MRKIGILFSLCFMAFGCFAQSAIELKKINVLYIDIDNPLTIFAKGIPDSNLLLIPSHGTIHQRGGSRYNWRISETGQADLYIIHKVKKDTLAKRQYRVQKIPEPEVLLGALYHSNPIQSTTFKAQLGIALVFKGLLLDTKPEIISYDVTYVSRDGDKITLVNRGAYFSSETSKLINHARIGDTYYFDNIRARYTGQGCFSSFNGLTFEIK